MQGFTYTHGERPLEGFTIQRAAGRGGFGEVYYALSDAGREVALKAVQGYEAIELRGISQCMNLKSPHLVTIFDVKYNDQGKPFVIMEYVNGPSLRQLLDESPAGLGPQKTAFFLREMAKGLTYLHDRGIVHRDLKPGNVFYEDGYVKIGDYGLSKAISASRHSGQTITVGTVHYMAPEIGEGRYDRGIDIYALGCMLYEMLTGSPPYLGGSPGEILMKHMVAQPDMTAIDEPFATVIRKALAKDPAERYQTVQEMVEAVFGAEHIRESVSVFSPESLSMVAQRVMRKVAVGGPGSSGQTMGVAGYGAGGTGADRPAGQDNWVDRVEDRVSRMGERIGRQLDAAADRLARMAGSGREPAAPPTGRPDVCALVDANRDPLALRQRMFLAVAAGALLALGTSVLGTRSFRVEDIAGNFLLSGSLAVGGWAGLLAARRLLAPVLAGEEGFVRHVTMGGVASFISLFVATPALLIRHDGLVGDTVIAILAPLFVLDWSAAMKPERLQRISLRPVLLAGLVALVTSWIVDGASVLAVGTVASMALSVQAASAFDPQAYRRRGRSHTVAQLERKNTAEAHEFAAAAQSQALRQAAHGAAPARLYGAERMSPRPEARRDRPLPRVVRGLLLLVASGMLGFGLFFSIEAITNPHGPDAIPIMFAGWSLIAMAVCVGIAGLRPTIRNWWSSLVRPVLLTMCGLAVAGGLVGIGSGVLVRSDLPVGIFLIVFPSVLFLVLLLVPASLFDPAPASQGSERAGKARPRPLSATDVANVSTRKRLWALLLTAGCFVLVCGLQRFYVGKIFTGFIWLVTGGLFGIGQIIDAILIATGHFTDRHGRRLVVWDSFEELTAVPNDSLPGWRPVDYGAAGARGGDVVHPGGPAAQVAVQATDDGPKVMEAPAATRSVHGEPSWYGSQRPVRRTSGVLTALAGLLAFVGMVLGVAGALFVPALAAVGAVVPDVAQKEWYQAMVEGGWAEIISHGEIVMTTTILLLAAAVLIAARRRAGGAHMLRSAIGTLGVLLSLWAFRRAMNPYPLRWVVATNRQEGGNVADLLGRMFRDADGGVLLAGLLLLASIFVLAWPAREPEELARVGKGV